MFIGQVNEIYMNANDYFGKTIKLEGILKSFDIGEGPRYFVVRNGPGCCGDDGVVGFEILWAETKNYPEPESWVEAVGVLQSITVNEFLSNVYLNLSSLTALNRRGKEFVVQ